MGNVERQEWVRKNMAEEGLVEGVDWDFWFYLDGHKKFAPLCKEGVEKCWEDGDPEPAEEYVLFNTTGQKAQRVSMAIYLNMSQEHDRNQDSGVSDRFMPEYNKSNGVTLEELGFRYGLINAIQKGIIQMSKYI